MSKALILAGRLKPDARLGLALSEFTAALDEESRKVFVRMRSSSSVVPTTSDVIRVTEELNREGAKRHRAWRPLGTRLKNFLSRIQSIASIGDVLVGGSQNILVCGVWCALRICLESTICFLDYYDKISSIFMKLGTAWSLHSDFAKLFSEDNELQSFLLEYLIGIVRLCQKIVVFTKKSALAQFASSMLSSPDNEFNPLIEELGQWGKLIEQKSNILSTEFMLKAEKNSIERNLSLVRHITGSSRKKQNFDQKYRLLLLLSPHQGSYENLWRRQRRKGSCFWIFETNEYLSWRSRDTSCVLWLNGSMGSGKTVTLANIVADIHLRQPCLYFFCVSKEPESLSFRGFLGSITYQLLRNIPLGDPFWSFDMDEVTSKLATLEGITDLLFRVTSKDEGLFLVVDGIENCNSDESDDIINFLSDLMKKRKVFLCSSGNPGSRIQAKLFSKINNCAQIPMTLNNQNRYKEIEDFIDREIERRTLLRPLDPDLKRLMREQLVLGAQGMYIWVALQIEAILPTDTSTIVSTTDILHILQNLPKDLPEAFDQALARVTDRRYGNRHFKIVAAATRPLLLDEFQVAATVTPGNIVWDAAALPLDPEALVYVSGGNLLEIDEEDRTVLFIHHSALVHLLSEPQSPRTAPFRFSLEEAELHMGSVCVTYLNYDFFDTRVATQQKVYADGILDKVITRVLIDEPRLGKLMGSIFKHNRRKTTANIDIMNQIININDCKVQDSLCLLAYAAENWLEHTRALDDDMGIQQLWEDLVNGMDHVQLPWATHENPMPPLHWAVLHSHAPLVKHFFKPYDVAESDISIIHAAPEPPQLGDKFLSDTLRRYITTDMVDWGVIKYFLDASASPIESLQWSPEILFRLVSFQYPLNTSIIMNFLDHPAVRFDQQKAMKGKRWADILLSIIENKAINDGVCPVIRRLIDLGISVNQEVPADSPLGGAIYTGNLDIVRLLLDSGATPSESFFDRKPIILLAFAVLKKPNKKQYAEDVIDLLLKYEPGALGILDTFEVHGLPLLCFEDDIDVLSLALGLGANPSVRSSDGRTPLHVTLTQLQKVSTVPVSEDILKLKLSALLASGADPNIKCNEGVSPVEMALRYQNSFALRSLLRKGGNANGIISLGCTLLQQASEMNYIECVRILLDYGACTDIKGIPGPSALQRAVSGAHVEIVQLLRSKAAEVPPSIIQRAFPKSFHDEVERRKLIIRMLLTTGAWGSDDQPLFIKALEYAERPQLQNLPTDEPLRKAFADIAMSFLNYGAVPNDNVNGQSILSFCLQNCWPELCLKLLKCGAWKYTSVGNVTEFCKYYKQQCQQLEVAFNRSIWEEVWENVAISESVFKLISTNLD